MKDGKHVILYVEDDRDMLDAMRLVLEKNGYSMVGAATAEQGLKAYKEANPDLIIVDLMMEEIDAGANLVKELQALGSRAPIYILSSVGDNLSMTIDHSELGVSGVFQKPINNDQLIRILRTKMK